MSAIVCGLSCGRHATSAVADAAGRPTYNDNEMRGLLTRLAHLDAGAMKEDVVALLGPPTADYEFASKEMSPEPSSQPRTVYGYSVLYVGSDGRTLPRVPRSQDALMSKEPTIKLEFDIAARLVAVVSNIEPGDAGTKPGLQGVTDR